MGHLQMRWRPLNLAEITALLFAITLGVGLVRWLDR
jgi:hypothetical protein